MIVWLFILSIHLLASTITYTELEYDRFDRLALQVLRWICIILPVVFWTLFVAISIGEIVADIVRIRRSKRREAKELQDSLEQRYEWFEDVK